MAATPTENSIAGRKITGWTLPVSSLDDKPKMTAAALKAAFDANTNQIKPALNGLIDDLLSMDGAGNIGTRAINGVSGTTVQTMLAALKALIDLRETTANVDSKLSTKADKTTVAAMVKSISFDAQTGTFTITEQGGTVHTIDTVLEKVPMACRLDGQDFVLTLEDGTEQRVSLAAFLTPNEFTDSGTVKFSVVGNTVTADIKPGSITLSMLENTLYSQLAALKIDAETAAANADVSAQNAAHHKADAAASQTAAAGSASEAAGQATLAKSWATGGTALRPGENEDNSRYYAGMAADAATAAGNQAAGASRSAADAANCAEQAAAEVTKAQTEADRAKSEADRAKGIVGGDYVTRSELTGHNTDSAAHGNIRIPITRITAAMLDNESGELTQQPVLNESSEAIDVRLLPDEIGSDVESVLDMVLRFVGFRIINGRTQSTCVKFTGVQVDDSTGAVDIKAPGHIRIGGSNPEADDVYRPPAIELDTYHGVTIIRSGSPNDENGPYIQIDEQEIHFCDALGNVMFSVTNDGYIEMNTDPDRYVRIGSDLSLDGNRIMHIGDPIEYNDATPKWYVQNAILNAVNSKLPQVFTVTIPATNAGATGSISRTFPSCTANETDCIVDASPAAASWDAFYDCNFRLKSISPTGFTYTVDSNLTSSMTVYITVQDITPLDTVPEGGA